MSNVSGSEPDFIVEEHQGDLFIPHEWERVVLHIHSNTMYYVYPTQVGMSRARPVILQSRAVLSRESGSESQ